MSVFAVDDSGNAVFNGTIETDGSTIYTYTGDPNGQVSANAKGDLCVDSSTPALWQAGASGSSAWQQIASTSFAHVMRTPGDPMAAPTSGAAMMGLGATSTGDCQITPAVSGNVRITIDGWFSCSDSDPAVVGAIFTMQTGTGTPPNNGNTTQEGTAQGATIGNPNGSGSRMPFSLTRTVTDMTVGTTYWIDVFLNTAGAGTVSIGDLTVTADEIP